MESMSSTYNLLVVDDERIEREGIRFLVRKYGIGVRVLAAENGEQALSCIHGNPVDILITDIRMPHMDGLELARRAKELVPGLKIVILSAYSDFEYARQAIDIGAVHYLLKPFQDREFMSLMGALIEKCRADERNLEHETEVYQGYLRCRGYESERFWLDAYHGVQARTALDERGARAGISFDGDWVWLVFFDMSSRFFESEETEYRLWLQKHVGYVHQYIPVDDRRSFLTVRTPANPEFRDNLMSVCRRCLGRLESATARGPRNVAVVVLSDPVRGYADIAGEFEKIGTLLEHRFFVSSAQVLTCGRPAHIEGEEGKFESFRDAAADCLERKDYQELCRKSAAYLEELRTGTAAHAERLKYYFADIVKSVMNEGGVRLPEQELSEAVNRVFHTCDVGELSGVVRDLLRRYGSECTEPEARQVHRAVGIALKLIRSDYDKNIGLDYVAEKVSLTASYVSYLFRRETGRTFLEHLTRYRLSKAKELLRRTNLRISDIAHRVGFANVSYFGSRFRQSFGVSPKEYRCGRGSAGPA